MAHLTPQFSAPHLLEHMLLEHLHSRICSADLGPRLAHRLVHKPHIVTEVQRDLKRARIEVEDLRGSEAKSSRGISKIQHALSVASNEAWGAIRDPLADHRVALNAAHVALQSAGWDLGS